MPSYLCLYRYSLTALSIVLYFMAAITAGKERVYYVDFERLNVTYWNPKYYEYMSCYSRRLRRIDPVHYVTMHYKTKLVMGNEILLDIYVYEFLSNEYRRSFVEMHFKLCDFVYGDKFFGSVFNLVLPESMRTCPFPTTEFRLENISIPSLPILNTFPFQKGRVFTNFSNTKTAERIVEAYGDVDIKSRWK